MYEINTTFFMESAILSADWLDIPRFLHANNEAITVDLSEPWHRLGGIVIGLVLA
jgi:hypothetical protein